MGIIGCGNMGRALLGGLLSNYRKERVLVYDKDRSKLSKLKKDSLLRKAKNLEEVVNKSSTIIIAVKPQDIREVLEGIRGFYRNQLIISIAAGITTSFIEKAIGKKTRVIRVMPNLPAKVKRSVTGLSKGRYASLADLKKAKRIFKSIGSCLVLKEKYINPLTAISGSGPGYIFYFLYCLEDSALSLGFSKEEAHFLVFNTFKGAGELISEKDDFLELVEKVASRRGTTEKALLYFKKKNFKRIVKEAIEKANKRAEELSKRITT